MSDHPQTILIATDLSARSDRPMERAILLADQLDAAVIIVHVPGSHEPLGQEQEQKLRERIQTEFDLPEADAEIVFEYGSVPTVIASVAEQRRCSLVVTGVARFDSPRDYILGTTVDYLVRRSPAPVLVVKRRPRKPYERLLVATDFSDCSAQALNAAIEKFPTAVFRVVHSFHAAFEAFLERETTIGLIREESDHAMEQLLGSLPDDARPRVEGLNVEGLLGDVIPEQLAEWRADMLVVGSHGRGGFAHATVGSIASALLQSAECDVMVVRGTNG